MKDKKILILVIAGVIVCFISFCVFSLFVLLIDMQDGKLVDEAFYDDEITYNGVDYEFEYSNDWEVKDKSDTFKLQTKDQDSSQRAQITITQVDEEDEDIPGHYKCLLYGEEVYAELLESKTISNTRFVSSRHVTIKGQLACEVNMTGSIDGQDVDITQNYIRGNEDANDFVVTIVASKDSRISREADRIRDSFKINP